MGNFFHAIAFLFIGSGPAMAEVDYVYQSHELTFHYPSTDYKREFSISPSSYPPVSYTVKLRKLNYYETDEVNIFSSNLLKCAQYSAMYDINEDTESGIVLGQFTEKVYKKKSGGGSCLKALF
ncbi:hypothetical protein [Silvimonas amylolytica]|uniref:Uncharacterized protein n=1 Tax=Silvimonas amylolytica TaxID=449663 RepID=A0ABQ2PL66_9NEIS|nr:hypothetical protein [Silvimonas amylolytica]GGP26359.1 hypothetical protein GCM10010971_21780 [Silvimonas amylolytica]